MPWVRTVYAMSKGVVDVPTTPVASGPVASARERLNFSAVSGCTASGAGALVGVDTRAIAEREINLKKKSHPSVL